MQGQSSYYPQLFSYTNIDSLIPESHILRKIDKLIDLSFTRKLTEKHYCNNNGRPSIDPELFFRMIVVSYLFGISSDRRLCEEISYNLAYRWYCRLNLEDKVPDHSSLTKIRDRYGEEIFEEFFTEIVNCCKKHGLVKGERIITDGTLIDANASLENMVARDPELEALEKMNDQNTTDPLKTFANRSIANKTHLSKSDPDSSLAKKNGSPKKLKYKIHTSIDADSRVILDNKATTGGLHEGTIYLERLEYISNKFNLSINEAIADRGYGSVENIQSLQSQNITTFIPLFSGRSGKIREIEDKGFKFDRINNNYTCPEGKILHSVKNKDRLTYRSKAIECKSCDKSKDCIINALKSGGRQIHRSFDQNFYEKEQDRMKQDIFIKRLRERMWKVEGINAEGKASHNLTKAKYRSLKKVQIQAFMIASIQNMKRIAANIADSTEKLSEYLIEILNIAINSISGFVVQKITIPRFKILFFKEIEENELFEEFNGVFQQSRWFWENFSGRLAVTNYYLSKAPNN